MVIFYMMVLPMDVCRLLLGRPWPFDKRGMHHARRNTYELEKGGMEYNLHLSNEEVDKAGKVVLPLALQYLKEVEQQEHVKQWAEENEEKSIGVM
jgi:hypothetical protein